jgi:hypothetical protein
MKLISQFERSSNVGGKIDAATGQKNVQSQA